MMRGFSGAPIMPRNASLSDSYSLITVVFRRNYTHYPGLRNYFRLFSVQSRLYNAPSMYNVLYNAPMYNAPSLMQVYKAVILVNCILLKAGSELE